MVTRGQGVEEMKKDLSKGTNSVVNKKKFQGSNK